MEISRELLIDIALNLSGYLAAGVFAAIVASLFVRPSRSQVTAEPVRTARSADTVPVVRKNGTEKSVEFVSLRSGDSSEQIATATRAAMAQPAEPGRYRRNRAEVMAVARQMLEGGSTRDQIKAALPLSDGELALLTNR